MKNDPLKQMMEWLALVIFATVLAVIVFLLNGCGDSWNPEFYCAGSTSPITQKIVGGEDSVDRRATVLVLVNNGAGLCSGVALDAHNVLTAGHCADGNRFQIALELGGPRVEVEQVTIHPAFSGKGPLHDLALMYTSQVLPGPYPVTVYDAAAGNPDLRDSCDYLLAQGFGKDETGTAGGLHETLFEVGGVSLYTLTTSAVGEGAGICSGDSGGPLYAFVDGAMLLAGITSTSIGYDCRFISQHVHLENYWPWVQENLK